MANLAGFECIPLPNAAISLDYPIMGGFLGHQVQSLLNGLCCGFSPQGLFRSFQLVGVQSGGYLNKSHGAPPVGQHIGVCMTGSRQGGRSSEFWVLSAELESEETEVLSYEFWVMSWGE